MPVPGWRVTYSPHPPQHLLVLVREGHAVRCGHACEPYNPVKRVVRVIDIVGVEYVLSPIGSAAKYRWRPLIIEFQRFISALAAERRREPREDLITYLVQARVEGIEPLSEKEVLVAVQELLVAGNETTRNTLTGGMALLLENPEQLALLAGDSSLASNAVEEILRLFTPVSGMWRIATRDTELLGVLIPKGAVVMV
jgi:cytochrome P450